MVRINKNLSSIHEFVEWFVDNEIALSMSEGEKRLTKDGAWCVECVSRDCCHKPTAGDMLIGASAHFWTSWCQTVVLLHIGKRFYCFSRYDKDENVTTELMKVESEIIDLATTFFRNTMPPNEYFRFSEACDGEGGHNIYAVYNDDGIVKAEFVNVIAERMGKDSLELSINGRKSPWAMLKAVQKYSRGEGKSEIRPER